MSLTQHEIHLAAVFCCHPCSVSICVDRADGYFSFNAKKAREEPGEVDITNQEEEVFTVSIASTFRAFADDRAFVRNPATYYNKVYPDWPGFLRGF